MPTSEIFHRIGLALAGPCLLLAVVLGAIAAWETRPIPVCGASIRFMPQCRNPPVPAQWTTESGTPSGSNVYQVEFGTVSGAPDLTPSGWAVLAALLLYLGSRGLGWILKDRTRHLAG